MRQTMALLLEGVLGGTQGQQQCDNDNMLLLSDQDQGGVTGAVSVQHSEALLHWEEVPMTVMGHHWQQRALPQLLFLSPCDRSMRRKTMKPIATGMLNNTSNDTCKWQHGTRSHGAGIGATEQHASGGTLTTGSTSLQTFQENALTMPPGPDRIKCLRNMDAPIQKLLAMSRIWSEHTSDSSSSSQNQM